MSTSIKVLVSMAMMVSTSVKVLVSIALMVLTLLAQRGRACGITAVAVVVYTGGASGASLALAHR